MSELRLFNYPGCKLKFVPALNEIINQAQGVDTYVEPFCATASTFFGLTKKFTKYVINDLSPDIISIIKAFRDGTYDQLAKMYDDVLQEFGDIKADKQAYYNFRNVYNARYYHKKRSVEKGFFLYMASRAAINSLFRVGPSGFNQSWGNRGNKLRMTREQFAYIQDRLQNCTIYMQDYVSIIDIFDDPKTLLFLDPPYVERKVQGSYIEEDEFDGDLYIGILRHARSKIVYTDVYSPERLEELGPNWKLVPLSDKVNISPGNNKEKKIDYKEGIYYNF